MLVLPLLAGALLLMHGLDAAASDAASHATAFGAAPPEHEHHAPASDEDHECDGCVAGHLMAACVGVVASMATVWLTRRAIPSRRATAPLLAWPGLIRTARELLRPPDPAWMRLGVMQR